MGYSNITALDDDGQPSFVALRHNTYVQAIVTVLVVCTCTRILSSHWFKSIKYGNGRPQAPPTLPYWIPFLRHALSMAWDTQRFTARCIDKYGDGTPFFIDAAGNKILILLDADQIKRVLNASKELDPNPFIHDMILGQMLGSPKEAIDFYKADNGQLDHVQMAHIRQHVTGSSLIAMSNKVYERLSLNIGEVYSSAKTSEWMEISDLFDFVQYHVTRAITECLMGCTITDEYPEFYADQWLFMDRSIEIVMGLPRFAIPTAYAARDRLLANLKKWSRKSEALRAQHTADGEWDATAGSGLLQERQELFAKTPGFDEDARVSQVLGLLFAGNGLTPPVSFWYLFEALKDPHILQRVSMELHTHRNPTTHTYDFTQLTVRPILQSLHAEATRFYSSNVVQRVLTAPVFALDDKYTIEKGTTLFVYTKPTGQFTPGWSEARPQATTQPLETFWAERFLVTGEGKRERFNDAGLGGSWTSFGGGEHKCPGRHFARNISIVTLAVLMGEYECELVEPEVVQRARPNVKETAFGKMLPTRKIMARIRKRST